MALSRDLALPIDPVLPQLVERLRDSQFVVLQAEPGAGKTTRVPLELQRRLAAGTQVWVTQPRRVAARLAAHYVAESLREPVGQTVGYSIRHEQRIGRETRVIYATEGMALRRLLGAPRLDGVGIVVLDEFHERHLVTDQLLALLTRLCQQRRDLRLVVMSATLEAQRVADHLGGAPLVHCPGRSFPLCVEYQVHDRPMESRMASAVREALTRHEAGDVLCFLPGVREIRRTEQLLAARPLSAEVMPLHGSQPIAQQARAIAPVRPGLRKVVLATNVAESSVTVDGVRIVIDSGLARIARHTSWNGLARLDVAPISQASAIQRAGRAARQGPGTVVRLYSELDFRGRPEQETPEIQRLDLAALVLELHGLGITQPDELQWLDAPPASSVEAALELLRRLSALDECSQLTSVGGELLELGLAPRLGRLVLAARAAGIGPLGVTAAALLSEGDPLHRQASDLDLPSGESDLEERIERLAEARNADWAREKLRALQLDPARTRQITLTERQLTRAERRTGAHHYERQHPGTAREDASTVTANAHPQSPARRRSVTPRAQSLTESEISERLRRCLLRAFPDFVARRTAPNSERFILYNGTTARLSRNSVVRQAPLIVALDVQQRREPGRPTTNVIGWASAIEADWLLEEFPFAIEATETLGYDEARGRVESIARWSYGSVTLDEGRIPAPASSAAAELLFKAATTRKTALFGKESSTETLRCRIEVLREHARIDGLPPASTFSDDNLLRTACESSTSMKELQGVDFTALILSQLTPPQRAALHRETPTEISLAHGRRLRVHYEPGKPPWVATRLQDFFGSRQGPTIASGRLPLVLHLLAPNQRAVQVTADLQGFWQRHYPEVRKELRRRYVKHAWPEDPISAEPPPHRPRRLAK